MSYELFRRQSLLPLAELDLRSLEGLLLIGTLVIVLALFLIAANRKKTPYKSL